MPTAVGTFRRSLAFRRAGAFLSRAARHHRVSKRPRPFFGSIQGILTHRKRLFQPGLPADSRSMPQIDTRFPDWKRVTGGGGEDLTTAVFGRPKDRRHSFSFGAQPFQAPA
ncbi:hypothetical protein REMIM1_PF00397 (plasmid) [Rhizobium etli bv. mimosae str. Mim1]|nr:hypothetical protein REMIM1_PF00397 [Rhizobium etli bv. mimosae str. Mim1]